ncbi:hypothetical protein CAPTEDRAFT_219606 [Capitella teleta]|uniref:Uracil-DNA glycosylase n=1 Tax=Capitella teleta TaxID=283909 RepID=R7ULL3_CAPTE|nr:hypothetical protein CAPTEDRAFT_219606 [Capitella teleta]|eukprot:ELU04167.1 hypothetical protein CAPTEDRAFT_219606 [Capitella teleta]
MSAQKSISSFFQPLDRSKRKESLGDGDADHKKLKQDKESKADVVSSPKREVYSSAPMLTPEQKKKIEGNRLQAQIKRLTSSSHGLLQRSIGTDWFEVLQDEFNKTYFSKLGEFLQSERSKHTVFPPSDQVFAWSQMCDFKDVKVVVLGQDPYHGPNQAHGLCFSVQSGIKPPPSLENMFKELKNDIDGFAHPGHGNLTGWARQGVLLLNAVLTVRAHSANSHKDRGWEKFTDAVISCVNKHHNGIVFLLWGSYAQKKGACIDKRKHHVLKGVHPSPLSAHRGFFGCKHFSQCNELLAREGKKPIDWMALPRC